MKNRLICMILTALFVFSAPASVFAAGTIQASVSFNYYNDTLNIAGTVVGERSNLKLAVQIKNANGALIGASQTTAKFGTNDEVVFFFPAILLANDILSGDLYVTISGHFVTTTEPILFHYVGTDKLLECLTAINEAGNSSLEQAILSNATILGANLALYENLDANGRTIFKTLMQRETYDLPDDFILATNKAKIKSEAARFRKNYQDAIAVGAFASATTDKAVADWLTDYYDTYGFGADDLSTSYNEVDITKYVEQLKTTKDFISRIQKSTSLLSLDKIQEYIYESTLLACIKEEHYNVSRAMIESFPGLFPVNKTDLLKLSETKRGTCYSEIAGISYSTYQMATDALNTKIALKLGNNEESDSSSSKGWGGLSGGVTKITKNADASVLPLQTDTSQDTKEPSFQDINTDFWANEAIMFLAGKGILKGKENDIFAPQDLVTRAEFIKMLIAALSVKTDENMISTFDDVSPEVWYAPYIAAAQKEGLVFGDEENQFCPNAHITRQDMVTLLYRAMKITATPNNTADFEDEAEISSYARNAVHYFYEQEMVKGMGDNLFGALQNATRAQAAQMLYNVMK